MEYKDYIKNRISNELYIQNLSVLSMDNIIGITKIQNDSYRIYHYTNERILYEDIIINDIKLDKYLIFNNEVNECYIEEDTIFKVIWKEVIVNRICYLYVLVDDIEPNYVYHMSESFNNFKKLYTRDYTRDNFNIIDDL